MPKSAAFKAKRKEKKKLKKMKLKAVVPKQSKMKAKHTKNGNKSALKRTRKDFSAGAGTRSLVTDGVNVGSVWKNTTQERVKYPMAREKYVDLVSAGTTFQELEQLYVNPGNSVLFPIFSNIARNYEQYECNHLKVLYRTKEYMASGSFVSAGIVALATNFDPDANNFASVTEAENYEHSISGAPFSGIIEHDILSEHRRRYGKGGRYGEAARNDLSLNNYYVNYSANAKAPSSSSSKFYDMGNFQCLIDGVQAGAIAELWIEYSFTMIRRLQYVTPQQSGAAHFTSGSATATAASPFDGFYLVDQSFPGTMTTSLGISTLYLLNVPIGTRLLIGVYWNDSVGTLTGSPTLPSYTGITFDNTAFNPSLGLVSNFDSADGTSLLMTVINATSANPTLTFAGPTGMTNGSGDVWVTIIPNIVSVSVSKEDKKLEDKIAHLEKLVGQLMNSQNNSQFGLSPGMCTPEEKECGSPALKIEQNDLSKSTVSLLSSLLSGRVTAVPKIESKKLGDGCKA